MSKRFLFFFLGSFLAGGMLLSQGTPSISWTATLTPTVSSKSQFIAVPFVFPKEAELLQVTPSSQIQLNTSDSRSSLLSGTFSPWVSMGSAVASQQWNPSPSLGSPQAGFVLSPESTQSSAGWWSMSLPQSFGKNHSASVVFLHKEFRFQAGAQFQQEFTGALNTQELSQMRLAFSYRIGANWSRFFQDNRLEIFLHLAEMQRSSNSLLAASQVNSRRDYAQKTSLFHKQIYAQPGITLGTNFLVFEGMIRVPLNAREANATLDTLWAPEVQGNLGMRYIFQ